VIIENRTKNEDYRIAAFDLEEKKAEKKVEEDLIFGFEIP